MGSSFKNLDATNTLVKKIMIWTLGLRYIRANEEGGEPHRHPLLQAFKSLEPSVPLYSHVWNDLSRICLDTHVCI
jgi:hypothetical protein